MTAPLPACSPRLPPAFPAPAEAGARIPGAHEKKTWEPGAGGKKVGLPVGTSESSDGTGASGDKPEASANTEQRGELSTLRSRAAQEPSCTRAVATGEQPCPPGAGSLSPSPAIISVSSSRRPVLEFCGGETLSYTSRRLPRTPSPVLWPGIFYPTPVCPTKSYSPLQPTGLSPPTPS